ncbi:hypothetical protein [Algivirga pacifica]|uniref:Uncharacterized protein n=1 Tax=Algivirga pacifica TaxID=1162670 RepID=A0ABP9DFX2_9BACT
MSTSNINTLHLYHLKWMEELTFFKEQVNRYEARLEKLAKRIKSSRMKARLEQIQNKFIVQKEVIDQLYHDIKIQEHELAEEVGKNPQRATKRLFRHQSEMGNRMYRFNKLYRDMKKDFLSFCLNIKRA